MVAANGDGRCRALRALHGAGPVLGQDAELVLPGSSGWVATRASAMEDTDLLVATSTSTVWPISENGTE